MVAGKRSGRGLPLKAAFMLCVLAFLLLALGLSTLGVHWIDRAGSRLREQAPDAGETYYLTTREGEQLGEGVRIYMNAAGEDPEGAAALELLRTLLVPVVFTLCIAAAALLFYRLKLRRPLALLNDASVQIMRDNLDFTLRYDKRDEMGRLCESFEKMRVSLTRSHQALWRQIEERERLNAAFAHDLRTPLTVLKGHIDLLRSDLPAGTLTREELLDTVEILRCHVDRLERYTEAMTRLQRLADLPVEKRTMPAAALYGALRDTADMLRAGKEVVWREDGADGEVSVDPEVVQQVFENLFANAARYAAGRISVRLRRGADTLTLTVEDDGPGFSDEDLRRAADPFYRADSDVSDAHLGLGLHIAQVLCEQHGGNLRLARADGGGARAQAVFGTAEAPAGGAIEKK